MKSQKSSYWRSLAELENSAEFRELLEREFAAPPENVRLDSPERRRFMQLMGASLALAGVTSCRWQKDKLLPFSQQPENMVPGEPRFFATSMELGGSANGLLVTSYDGRPIKVEGNPEHPSSGGAANLFHQASLLSLYDPDRSESVVQRSGGARQVSSWDAFEALVKERTAALRANGGKGLRVLAEPSSSPSLADMRRRLLAAFPSAQWIEFSTEGDNQQAGSLLAFGSPYRSHPTLGNANVVLSLDCDLVGPTHPFGVANARGLVKGRTPDSGNMNRLYAVESTLTLTGSIADHRLPLRSELVKAFAAALDAEVSAKVLPPAELGPAQAKPQANFLKDPKVFKFLAVLASDLAENRGASAILAGAHQPPEVHALAHRMNAVLSNIGRTVLYRPELNRTPDRELESLKRLTEEMRAGAVDTLLIIGANPALTAPADLDFASALGKVSASIALGEYEDETARLCNWHLPLAHYLESWGDARAHDGTLSLIQPLILPLHGGRSALEVLALFAGDNRREGLDIVRRTHAALLGSDRAWNKAVHDGFAAGTTPPRFFPTLKPLSALQFSARELGDSNVSNGALELVFLPDSKVYDGRFANNSWLQELADPLSKQSWGNAARMSPKTAAELRVGEGDLVQLTLAGRSLELPAIFTPGQAEGTVAVSLGYGRHAAGHVGGLDEAGVEPVGANAYALRTIEAFHIAPSLSVARVGGHQDIATTQDLYAIDPVGKIGSEGRLSELVREATLEEFKKEPHFAREAPREPLLSLWSDPVSYQGHRWGMSIDLNRCIGCNACVVACVSENNIPVVGKANVIKGREMFWLRVDRYFKGPPEEPQVSFQPIPCQQCENAPCEQVCPVGATMHSHEGLNDMVYNRCIGTRYCSSNCPYKVRRFNYFNYHLDKVGVTPFNVVTDRKKLIQHMAFNPEVTVRARGVMEKCTFCVQRIEKTKIKAKNARRSIQDGEIKTACQQTCPTDAIVFGDLSDSASQVARLQALPRAYALLEELNNRPRVRYLARVRNPHPELA